MPVTVSGKSSHKSSPTRGAGQRVLVVSDDPGTLELLSTTFGLAGYRVVGVGTRAEALARLSEQRFDLLVLDTVLKDLKDFNGRPRLAAADRPPMLFLTSVESLGILAPGLDGLRASDYVTKPLRIAEVLARAQVLLNSRNPGRDRAPRYGDLALDDATCQARRGRRELDLTPAEYRLLRHLMVNAERVFSKEQIGRYVWGEGRADNAIEKLVSRLRSKVDQEQPSLIHNRRGFGYWLGGV